MHPCYHELSYNCAMMMMMMMLVVVVAAELVVVVVAVAAAVVMMMMMIMMGKWLSGLLYKALFKVWPVCTWKWYTFN